MHSRALSSVVFVTSRHGAEDVKRRESEEHAAVSGSAARQRFFLLRLFLQRRGLVIPPGNVKQPRVFKEQQPRDNR